MQIKKDGNPYRFSGRKTDCRLIIDVVQIANCHKNSPAAIATGEQLSEKSEITR